MAFSQRFIEEIKDRNDIVELISKYVALKRAGSNMSGLCPFHNEKTPSFTVFPKTRSYYCFGCGAGGDAVSFVMGLEGLGYRDAVEYLANRAGIPMEDEGEARPRDEVRRDRVIAATTEAARFFYTALVSPQGASAREYLEKRGLDSLTVRRFGIGYAPDSWDSLARHLTSKGFTPKELEAAFLCRTGKNGKLYDIFRNRIAFPLIDPSGAVLGFSARRLNEADERKYVNTSDTPAFKKSKFVFGLNIAKNSQEGSLIMCEGCMDAVALHQAGFSNAVATLGTAITSEQARLIARSASTVYLCYDSDNAGKSATLKGIRLLGEVGVNSRILNLGEVKDPDEYIKKYGASAFKRVLADSSGQIDYRLKEIAANFNLSIPEEKLRAFDRMCEYAGSRQGRAEREICAARISELTGVSFTAAAEGVERKAHLASRKTVKEQETKGIQEALGFGDKVNRDRVRLPAATMIEERVLGILLVRPELYSTVSATLTEDSFLTDFNRKVFALFREDLEAGREITLSKGGALTPEELSRVAGMQAARLSVQDNSADSLAAYIKSLEREKMKADYDADISARGVAALEEYIAKLKKDKKSEDGNNG
ncbi:MAG: DNA primase [Clostridia bacterium]|nr:DNA primase [Clostridia bacterium]